MFRPTGFADLAGRRVGLFGYGLEGRAAEARLRDVARELVIVDDQPDVAPHVLPSDQGGLAALATCDVVLKSPGIPRRRADVLALEAQGVRVTSALNLWLHDVDRSRVIAITGTKGKSTTTALTAFVLDCLGEPALRLGNIGQPPYAPDVDTSRGWLVLEVSSFQCVDLERAPGVVVVTSLGADHLDWHGGLEQYQRDKLSLTRLSGAHRTYVPATATFVDLGDQLGGDVHFVEAEAPGLARALGLLGAHSDANVALALHVAASVSGRSLDDVRRLVAHRATAFEPLRGRLTLVAEEHDGPHAWRYVDDGLATSVLPARAALEVFADEPLALLAGGFDRGVDYAPLARALAERHAPTALFAMGPAGQRLADELNASANPVAVQRVDEMGPAVALARRALREGGVILLSPGAPSFDRYRNWEERSADFTLHAQAIAATKGGASS